MLAMFKDIMSKGIKEVLSINTTIKVFLGVLIIAFIVGFCAAHFKKNKIANILEECSEKIIQKEIGMTIDFSELTQDNEKDCPLTLE